MTEWRKQARAATRRICKVRLAPELRRYPPDDELWKQPRGEGPRLQHWLGIFWRD